MSSRVSCQLIQHLTQSAALQRRRLLQSCQETSYPAQGTAMRMHLVVCILIMLFLAAPCTAVSCLALLHHKNGLPVARNVMHRNLCRSTALWSYQRQHYTIKELCLWPAVAFIPDNRTPTAHETGCVHLRCLCIHNAAQSCLFCLTLLHPMLGAASAGKTAAVFCLALLHSESSDASAESTAPGCSSFIPTAVIAICALLLG